MPAVEDVTVLLRLRDDLSRHLARVERQIQRTTGELDAMGRQGARTGTQVDSVGRSLAGLSRANSSINAVTGNLLKISTIGAAAATAGVLGLTAALGAVGVSSAASFEQSRIAFGTLLEDTSAGLELFKELQAFNVESPFELQSIAQATQTLLQFGFSGENVVASLKSIANVSALTGPLAEQNLGRIAIALGQIRSAGVLRAQDLNQLVQAGFPAYELLQQVTGETTQELRKQMESGLTLPAQEYIDAMNAGQGVMAKYATGAETMANTLTGQWSAIKDAAKVSLADAFAPLATSLVDTLRETREQLPALLGGVAPQMNTLLSGIVRGGVGALPGILDVVAAGLDGIQRLAAAAAPALGGLSLSDGLVRGIDNLVDDLVPVMPDLARGFAGLVEVLPEAIGMLGDLIALTAPVIDFVGALAESEAGNTAMAGLLVTLVGFGALTTVIGPVLGLATALYQLAGARAAAGAGGAAGAAGLARNLGRGLGIAGGAAGLGAAAYGGYHDGVGAGYVLGGAANGALFGATVGSIFPVVGTGVGAAVGGVLGGAAPVVGSLLRDTAPRASAPALSMAGGPRTVTSSTNVQAGAFVIQKPATEVDVARAVEVGLRDYELQRAEREGG